jgi:hypothetical protein
MAKWAHHASALVVQRRDDLVAQTIRLALLAQPQHARHLVRLRVGG